MLRTLALLLLLGFCSNSIASTAHAELNIESISSAMNTIESGIQDKPTLLGNLDIFLEQLPPYTNWVKTCTEKTGRNVLAYQNQLAQLGGAMLDEPGESKSTRNKLLDKISNASKTLSSCKALLVRIESATREISEFRQNNLQKQSFSRGINFLTAVSRSVTESHQWVKELGMITVSEQGLRALSSSQKLMLMSIIALAVIFGLMIRKALQRWNANTLTRWQHINLDEADTGTRVVAAFAITVRRYIIPVLLSLFVGLFVHYETLDQVPKPLLTIVMDSLPALVGIYALTYFVYFAFRELGLRNDERETTDSLRKRLNILATIWFLGYLMTQTILSNSLPEAAFFMARALLGMILVINIIWIIWRTRDLKGPRFNQTIRVVSSLVLVMALIAEFTGYRNLSGFALQGVVGTLVLYGLFKLATDIISHLLKDLDEGNSPGYQRFRQSIGVKDDASFPGIIWLKFIAAVATWLLFIWGLLLVWRVPNPDVQMLVSKLTQGFSIGTIEIVPLKFLEAIAVFALMLSINGWFQRILDKTWLTAARIERGARESISTVSNYAGIGIAVVIALAVAGLDFSKLAIVAGALSVGIGFGLQNIVNNFVSGLILLFERPIKTGDWIVAGGVEGFVKKISIRSTEIESFDRADIIVPNSVLISDNLTNWVHKNRNGRLRIPIGVAYGTDTEKVKKLLLDVAHNQRDVIFGHPGMHDPKVLFLAFGDSSLNFELRFYVRDITSRLDIQSEVNFEIDKVFRENSIEIPFPQRDVHIHDALRDQVTTPDVQLAEKSDKTENMPESDPTKK